MPYLNNIENLVLQGGGVRGVAYLGALQTLTQQQADNKTDLRKIKRVCGASAGAICALLLALGYSIDELTALLTGLQTEVFLDHDGPTVGGFNNANTFIILYEISHALTTTPDTETTAFDLICLFLYKYVCRLGYDWIADKARGMTNQAIANKIKASYPLLESLWDYCKSNQKIVELQQWFFGFISRAIFSKLDAFLMAGIEYFTPLKLSTTNTKIHQCFVSQGRVGTYEDFIGSVFNVFNALIGNHYLFSGQALLRWFYERIDTKLPGKSGTLTFAELHEIAQLRHRPDLYLVGVNLSTGYTQVFSYLHTPNSRVAEAVRVSMSIPFFFAPYKMHDSNDLWTDGGVNDNYPIWVFDKHGKSNPYTLGLRLVDRTTKTIIETGNPNVGAAPQYNAGLVDYTKALASAVWFKQESDFFHSHNLTRTILIDVLNVGMVEFGMPAAKQLALIQSGKDCSKAFLKYRESYEDIRRDTNLSFDSAVIGFCTSTLNPINWVAVYDLIRLNYNSNAILRFCALSTAIPACSARMAAYMLPQYRFGGKPEERRETLSASQAACYSAGTAFVMSSTVAYITYLVAKEVPMAGLGAWIAGMTGLSSFWTFCAYEGNNKNIAEALPELPDGWRNQLDSHFE